MTSPSYTAVTGSLPEGIESAPLAQSRETIAESSGINRQDDSPDTDAPNKRKKGRGKAKAKAKEAKQEHRRDLEHLRAISTAIVVSR